MEWIPLFILCWYALLTRPHPLLGLAAALALWLVILCDNYYFTYCLLSAILIVFWYAITGRSLRLLLRKEFIIPLLLFAGAALLLVGPQVRDLLISNYLDPLKGAHDPTIYSLDLLALIIPGGMWMFNHWTAAYWSRLPGNISENSVFLALPVLAFVVWLWVKRRSLDPAVQAQLYLWSSLFGGFFLLALGPLLHVGGTVVWSKFMPYALLSQALPFLSLSGVPARMAVMVILSAALLSAFALRELFSRFPHNRLLTLGLLGILVFEALPIPIMTTTVDVPGYVSALARLPNDGGVLDLTGAGAGYQLYYQTIHGKPIVGGYLARLPASVGFDDWKLSLAVQALDYARLWGMYHIRYIVAAEPLPIPSNQPYILLTLVYDQADARIYRIGCVCETQH